MFGHTNKKNMETINEYKRKTNDDLNLWAVGGGGYRK